MYNSIMNNKFNATASAALSTSSYVAPKSEMLGVTVEGMLCASAVGSNLSVKEWEVDNTFSW